MRDCIDVTCACCGRDWPGDAVRMARIGGAESDVCSFCMAACPLCDEAVEEGDAVRVHEDVYTERWRVWPDKWQTRRIPWKRLAHSECVEQAERESEATSASDRRENFWGDK